MLNNVSLVGRLTKDPEVKTLNENTTVCNFTLAVNRPFAKEDSEQTADFIQCQAWNKQADFIGTYLVKGQMIAVTGAINTRTYEKDGVTHFITEVNCNSVQSLERAPLKTEEQIRTQWTKEWDQRSSGLDAKAKATLKKELEDKYQPMINALPKPEDEKPF